jgi:hypothetical protein
MTAPDADRVPSPQEVAESLRRNLGMTVTSVSRQTRWRPCWFLEAQRDGEAMAVVVRGDRIETTVQPRRGARGAPATERHHPRTPRGAVAGDAR